MTPVLNPKNDYLPWCGPKPDFKAALDITKCQIRGSLDIFILEIHVARSMYFQFHSTHKIWANASLSF